MTLGRLGEYRRLVSRERLLLLAGLLINAWRLLAFQSVASSPSPAGPVTPDAKEALGIAGTLAGPNMAFVISALGAVLSCAALMTVTRRRGDLATSTPCYIVGFSLAGASLTLDALALLVPCPALPAASALCLGLSDGVVYPLYVLNHTNRRPDEIIFLIAAEALLGQALCQAMRVFLTGAGSFAVAAALVAVSGVLLRKNALSLRDEPQKTQLLRENRRLSTIPYRSFCALIACFAVSRGCFQALTVTTEGSFSAGLPGMAVAHLLLAFFCLFLKMRSLQTLLLSAVAVMVLGVAGLPFYSADIYLASLVHQVGFTAFVVIRWGFVPFFGGEEATRRRADVVYAFTMCSHAGKAAGAVAVEVLPIHGEVFYTLPLALLCLVVGVVLAILLVQQQGTERADGSADELRESRLDRACYLLKGTYDLTDREAEVMRLVTRGRSSAQICQELLVSQNTIKTHLKHIYVKTSVHTRDELRELVEQAADGLP